MNRFNVQIQPYENPEGDWVAYEDHRAALARLEIVAKETEDDRQRLLAELRTARRMVTGLEELLQEELRANRKGDGGPGAAAAENRVLNAKLKSLAVELDTAKKDLAMALAFGDAENAAGLNNDAAELMALSAVVIADSTRAHWEAWSQLGKGASPTYTPSPYLELLLDLLTGREVIPAVEAHDRERNLGRRPVPGKESSNV